MYTCFALILFFLARLTIIDLVSRERELKTLVLANYLQLSTVKLLSLRN